MLTTIFCIGMFIMVIKGAFCLFRLFWKAFFWIIGGIIIAAALFWYGLAIIGIITMLVTFIGGCICSAAG